MVKRYKVVNSVKVTGLAFAGCGDSGGTGPIDGCNSNTKNCTKNSNCNGNAGGCDRNTHCDGNRGPCITEITCVPDGNVGRYPV